MERAIDKMKIVVPLTLLIIFLLLYLNFKRRTEALTVMLSAPFALVGGVRPKMMTVVAIMAGLLQILWSTGTGSEVMSHIAAPMVGGMISSTVLTLVVIPAIYALVKQWRLKKGMEG